MKTQLLALSLATFGLTWMIAPQAQACDGYGYGYGYGLLYNSLDNRVPHFAAHPPVYYSYPVPRTYGYSPFAYPPHVMTPDVAVETAPLEIINPYVPSSQQESAKESVDRTASVRSQPQPLVILNPYVAGQGSIAQAKQ